MNQIFALHTMLKSTSPLGIGIIGAGYWGPNLVRNFDALADAQVHWVCDKKPGRLEFIREKFPHVPLTDDLDVLINDPRVDAIVIATPVSTHRDLALRALDAGKHLFIEKPLADSTMHAKDIVRAGVEAKRIIAVGHIFLYNPAVLTMRELISAGAIGQLCYAESGRVNLGPPASEVNVIWDLAVHDLAVLLYLWNQLPIQVTAYGKNFVHPSLTDVAFLHVAFADGTFGEHHISWLSPEKVRRFFVAGTNGSLKFDDMATEGKLRQIDQGIDSRIGLADGENKELYYKMGKVLFPTLNEVEPLQAECQHFVECIRNGVAPRADGESGLQVVRLLEAANWSLQEGSIPIRI